MHLVHQIIMFELVATYKGKKNRKPQAQLSFMGAMVAVVEILVPVVVLVLVLIQEVDFVKKKKDLSEV